ncbi:MAG: DUF362 domain-containing protein [Planctomycetes bacterium]|nr:DUF362 domain-containing protein [Planctomycetota bacterium]
MKRGEPQPHHATSRTDTGNAPARPVPTRREFIRDCALLAAVGPTIEALAGDDTKPPAGGTAPEADATALAQCHMPTPDVVRVQSPNVIVGNRTHPKILAEMLGSALLELTGTTTVPDAWHRLLEPDERIVLKFNQSGAGGIGTTAPMAETLVASLGDAGFEPQQLTLMEVPQALCRQLGCIPPHQGWEAVETDFGSGKDHLASALGDIDAIINVPFLKNHNIAGLTCCLKNLSHALVKHPARFHGQGCSPYVADIVALPEIRSKLRLNIVNALRVVWDRGPQARLEFTEPVGAMILGQKPLTVDTIALALLDDVRAGKGLGSVVASHGQIAYFAPAAARGLGTHERHKIATRRLSVSA